jgi:hypothetical protein
MEFRRAGAVALCAWCGCAAATGRDTPSGSIDAPSSGGSDASTNQNRPDAPVRIDAPQVTGSCSTPFSGVLATWDFTGAAGNQASTSASQSATGVSAGDAARSASLTAMTGANSINSSGWATGASPDPTKFYTFGLQPPSGCSMTLTSLAIDTKASATGPSSASVATSDDGFTQSSDVNPNAATAPALSVNASTAIVELRVYGYGASSASGTFRIQNTLTVTGSLQ